MSSYSVELISGLKPKNNGNFPLVRAHDVEVDDEGTRLDEALKGGVGAGVLNVQTEQEMLDKSTEEMTLGMFCYVVEQNITYRLEQKGSSREWVPFGTTVVNLNYTDGYPEGAKVYYQVGDRVLITVYFSATNNGKCNISVYRNNILYSSDYYNKGTITLDLGEATAEGTYNYTITGADAYGNNADQDLKFTVVVGGVTLISNVESILKNGIESGIGFSIPYEVSCADVSQVPKISASIVNNTTHQIVKSTIIGRDRNESTYSGTWKVEGLENGSYTVSMIAYSGSSLDDPSDDNVKSSTISYTFNVLDRNEIVIQADTEMINNMELTTNTFVNIPYTVLSLNASVLGMNGTLTNRATGRSITTSPRSIVSGSSSVWAIGYIDDGVYDYTLIGTSRDGTALSTNSIHGTINVVLDTTSRFTPVTDNLVCWFDANDMANSMDDPSVWKDHADGNLHIKLHDLNYSSNGWKFVNGAPDTATDGGQKMLKFTGDSYGELLDASNNPYSPFSTLTSTSNGFTLEVMFRTRCIGDLNTKVLTCQHNFDKGSPGLSAAYNKLYLYSNSSGITLDVNEENWIHATFVVDRTTNRTKDYVGIDKIENMNPIPMMHIYINGSLCCSGYIGTDSFLSSTGESYPMYLNATMTPTGVISNFGECEIQCIRMYNAPLTAEQVVNNRISSILDVEEQTKAAAKNELSVPTVTFTQKPESTRYKTTAKKISTSFEVMNKITAKSDSKTNFVDCVATYVDPANNINEIWDYCEVYLQGTSSLQYPVKNYKIKLFKDEEHKSKNKIVLPANPINGSVWQKENVFTLKCDFMESSHLNNTPTANFYAEVVSKVCAGHYSPARQYQEDNPDVEAYYKDAIDGFPIVVYYADAGEVPTYAGTFMFNLDKSGDTLGFKLDIDDGEGNKVSNRCQSFEGVANTADSAGCFVAYDVTPESNKKDKTELEYLAKDFESRYDYNGYDDFDLDELTPEQQEEYYGPLRDMVNWVSYAADARISKQNVTYKGKTYTPSTFRNEIEEHFNIQYCYAYMLQMMMLGQADNAGKNCMWDTWDGQIWYPRPYDMDTQVGLSNTGLEDIEPDCEINPMTSPAHATPGSSYSVNLNNSGVEQRYMSYNTKNSKFWNTFALEFRTELMAQYGELRRAKIYDTQHIMQFYKSYTTDILGEAYYNKDMAAKYFTQVSDTDQAYLRVVHGNREQKFESWINRRITFLDTYYEYVGPGSGNQIIEMRSDASTMNGGTTVEASLGIQVFTPQYVTIKVGQSQYSITAYVGPDSTYVDPRTGQTKEGTLFTFPITGDDKEINISGCSNIKNIDGLNDLNLHTLTFNHETKLLSLDLSYSTRMVELIPGYNLYLQSLNLSHASMLGSSNGFQTLTLDNCTRIKDVDVSYTKLTGISFAEGSNIHSVDMSGSLITSLTLSRQQFLTDVNIDNCENLNYYDIEYCPNIKTLSIDGSTTGTFKLIGCQNVETVSMRNCNNIATFDIESCPNIKKIDMFNNSSSFLDNGLDLTDFYNLQNLNLEGASRLRLLKLPRYASANSTRTWDSITTLNIKNSGIKYLGYGSSSNPESINCANLYNVTSMSFSGCNNIEYITNLNYTGPTASLFYLCTNLKKITGRIVATGTSANSCFSYCESLTDLSELETDFSSCTSFNSGFSWTNAISFTTIAKVLNTFGENLKSLSSLCANKNTFFNGNDYSSIEYASDTNYKLPNNMFNTIPNVENLDYAFYKCRGIKELTVEPFRNKFNNLKSLSATFMYSSNIETVEEGFLQTFRINRNTSADVSITNLNSTFWGCSKIKTCIYNASTFFDKCTNATTIAHMFGNCSSLEYDGSIASIFAPLVNIENVKYVFYGCSSLTSTISEYSNSSNFIAPFKNNTKLQNINGCFARSGITQQFNEKHTLFGNYDHSASTHKSLLLAKCVFSGCTNISGVVGPYFFSGANYINNVGLPTEDTIPDSTSRFSSTLYGLFYNTRLNGYYDNFLQDIPNVTSVSGLFRNCTNLQDCYKEVENGEDIACSNSLSSDLFGNLEYLVDGSYAFYGCSSLRGNIPSVTRDGISKSFFEGCKQSLADVSYMFYGCNGGLFNGQNSDNRQLDNGLNSNIFENCIVLTNVSNFMRGCENYIITSFPDNIFRNCNKLINTSYMFTSCKNIAGVIPSTLFDSCRSSLTNVSYMFSGCTSLTGIETNNVTNIGLLGDCANLTTVCAMFNNCISLKGMIPTDMFNMSSVTSTYSKLTNMSFLFQNTGFDKGYVDEVSGDTTKYLVPQGFFSRCRYVTEMRYTFAYLKSMESNVQLHPLMFQHQYYLQNASGMFYADSCISGGLSNTFMINCISTLTNISYMFCWNRITSINNTLFHDPDTSRVNKVLRYVAYAFYGCSSITSAATPLYETALYSMIQSGNPGRTMCYAGCTNISNYSSIPSDFKEGGTETYQGTPSDTPS